MEGGGGNGVRLTLLQVTRNVTFLSRNSLILKPFDFKASSAARFSRSGTVLSKYTVCFDLLDFRAFVLPFPLDLPCDGCFGRIRIGGGREVSSCY
jgi:hypothetical protein